MTKILKPRSATPPSEAAAGAGIGVLEKAMGLLNIVSSAPVPMTFTELLRTASLPKATLHRILATLIREGLLLHDPYTRTYRLGFRLLELAHEVWSDFDLRLAAQDEMVRLRDALAETVFLAVLDGDSLVLLASEEASREMRIASKVGERMPIHATAVGKVIVVNRAAFQALEAQQRFIHLDPVGVDRDHQVPGIEKELRILAHELHQREHHHAAGLAERRRHRQRRDLGDIAAQRAQAG